ncbi:MAG: radical SAM protein [Myxococcota bacterium]
MSSNLLPPSAELKLDLLFEGVRYSEALGRAGAHSFPNFAPHKVEPGEYDPDGTGSAPIPYMLITEDGTHCRLKTSKSSPWSIGGSREQGYRLERDGGAGVPVSFEPAQAWMARPTSDGLPAVMSGLSIHGDMGVVNVAPGCQYFTAPKRDGVSMRCTFCTYGAPDQRTRHLGQEMDRVEIPEPTLARLAEVLRAALDEGEMRTLYLVGGSMTDPAQEGERFIALARRVQEVLDHRIPVTCGSGALPEESMRRLRDEELVDAVCFNLEVWSEPLFAKVCPGKHRYVGYDAWIEALETAVGLWGRERVYSAMVGGIELAPPLDMDPGESTELAVRGAEDLCSRGILPIYSLYWPPTGRDLPEQLGELRSYFERLQHGYAAVRRKHDLHIWEGMMTHRSAYMQLECDIDRAGGAADVAEGAA